MELGSRRQAQIRAQDDGPAHVVRIRDHRDQPGPFHPIPDGREDAPAVDGRESEVDDHRIEALPPQELQGGVAVGRDDRFDVFQIGVAMDHQHTRDHRAPPP
jgi:hypothetical protein